MSVPASCAECRNSGEADAPEASAQVDQHQPGNCHARDVQVVQPCTFRDALFRLSVNDLSTWTRRRALATVGQGYEVEKIELYGPGAWIRNSWAGEDGSSSNEIATGLEPRDMGVASDQCV